MPRIDVHQHLIPPGYVEYLETVGRASSGGRSLPSWSVEGTLQFMDELRIDSAVLSLSAPGVWGGDPEKAAAMAAMINEYGAELVKDRPERFGYFACLPMPDIDRACGEAITALDQQDADGIVLLANSEGVYLGDPAFESLMAELDARDAVVFIHPTNLPEDSVDGVPPFAVDFLLDTTRAAVNLLLRGVPSRYKRIKFILPHAGGFVPYASQRIAAVTAAHGLQRALGGEQQSIEHLLGELRSFYFDTALSAGRETLSSLFVFAAPRQVLFGSDNPYPPRWVIERFAEALSEYRDLTDAERSAIDSENALQILPRLAGRTQANRV